MGDPPDPRSKRGGSARLRSLGSAGAAAAAQDFSGSTCCWPWTRTICGEHAAALRRRTSHIARGCFWRTRANAARARVPDPYYGGAAGFESVLDLAEHGVARAIRRDRRESPVGWRWPQTTTPRGTRFLRRRHVDRRRRGAAARGSAACSRLALRIAECRCSCRLICRSCAVLQAEILSGAACRLRRPRCPAWLQRLHRRDRHGRPTTTPTTA